MALKALLQSSKITIIIMQKSRRFRLVWGRTSPVFCCTISTQIICAASYRFSAAVISSGRISSMRWTSWTTAVSTQTPAKTNFKSSLSNTLPYLSNSGKFANSSSTVNTWNSALTASPLTCVSITGRNSGAVYVCCSVPASTCRTTSTKTVLPSSFPLTLFAALRSCSSLRTSLQ